MSFGIRNVLSILWAHTSIRSTHNEVSWYMRSFLCINQRTGTREPLGQTIAWAKKSSLYTGGCDVHTGFKLTLSKNRKQILDREIVCRVHFLVHSATLMAFHFSPLTGRACLLFAVRAVPVFSFREAWVTSDILSLHLQIHTSDILRHLNLFWKSTNAGSVGAGRFVFVGRGGGARKS